MGVKTKSLLAWFMPIGAACVLAGCGPLYSGPSLHLSSYQLATEQSAGLALELGLPALKWPNGIEMKSSGTIPLISLGSLSRFPSASGKIDSLLAKDGYAGGAVSASFIIHQKSSLQEDGNISIAIVKLDSHTDARQLIAQLSNDRGYLGGALNGVITDAGFSATTYDFFTFASGDYFVHGSVNCSSSVECGVLAQSIEETTRDAFSR